MKLRSTPRLWLVALAGALPAIAARADERPFTFVYEASTTAKGKVEYEQWATWETHTHQDPSFNRLDFRHELEIGLTDRMQIGLYLADWHYQSGRDVEEGAKYDDSAVEVIYQLSDPSRDALGSAVYGEVRGGNRFLELESKVILQKNWDGVVAAYNLTLEAQWEGQGLEEHNGELSQSLGVSYELSPRWRAGIEALHEVPLPDWKTGGAQTVFAGPDASYRAERWYVTVTPMVQLTHVSDEPKLELRLVAGVSF